MHDYILENVDGLVGILVDEQGNLQLQLVRELIHEAVYVVLILVALVLDLVFQCLVQVQRQKVFFLNPVQNGNSLLQLLIRLVVVLED